MSEEIQKQTDEKPAQVDPELSEEDLANVAGGQANVENTSRSNIKGNIVVEGTDEGSDYLPAVSDGDS